VVVEVVVLSLEIIVQMAIFLQVIMMDFVIKQQLYPHHQHIVLRQHAIFLIHHLVKKSLAHSNDDTV
jgi:hypothetical protein